MPQQSFFTDGGFVLHKIKLDAPHLRYSAWFDRDGKLIDCEGYGRTRSYTPGCHMRDRIADLGPIYRKSATQTLAANPS